MSQQILINNGRTQVTPSELLNIHDWDTIVHYMDDATREKVHNELAPCDKNHFLALYLEIAEHPLVI